MPRKIIVTAAVTGASFTPTMSPFLPYKPDHVVADSLAAGRAALRLSCPPRIWSGPLGAVPPDSLWEYRVAADVLPVAVSYILWFALGPLVGDRPPADSAGNVAGQS